MTKGRGQQQEANGANPRSRRHRAAASADPNEAFLLAFADALRDILREEHRRAA